MIDNTLRIPHLSEPAPSRSIPRSKTPIAQFGGARDTPFFIFRRAKIFAHQAPQPENTPLTAHPPARAVHKSPTQHLVQSGEVPAATNIHHSGKMKKQSGFYIEPNEKTKGMTKSQFTTSPLFNP